MNERFCEAVEKYLYDTYHHEGKNFKGQAISFLQKSLRDDGWKKLGNLADFETLITSQGFKVAYNLKNFRGNVARVVVLSKTRNVMTSDSTL